MSYASPIAFIRQHQLQHFFSQIQRGIEKESLRINAQGALSQKPHPLALGAALTHSTITTDYSESLLEFITGVHSDIESCLQELNNIQRFVYQQLNDEILWVASMPCFIADEKEIPIAQYGSSNIGRMKHTYRIGLGHRYGRLMQTIAGLHYNFSLSDIFWKKYQSALANQDSLKDFKNQQYLHLIRNFQRHAWLLVYLFAASPAVCSSFIRNRQHQLIQLANGDWGYTHSTSLRMSDLGYQSEAQKSLHATYNNIEDYVQLLLQALLKEHPQYAAIGLKDAHGFLQLNTHLLQIENEFYSIIRPKTVAHRGEAPLHALSARGIEYIEVRCLDLNPFLALGINAEQIRFIDTFLLFCLFNNSPALDEAQLLIARENFNRVVAQGLNPELILVQDKFKPLANTLMQEIQSFAQLLDETHDTQLYTAAIASQMAKIEEPRLSPAGQIKELLIAEPTQHFFHWALKQSQQIAADFINQPLDISSQQQFMQQAQDSLHKQAQLEQSDQLNFEAFCMTIINNTDI